MVLLPGGETILTICSAVLTQYGNVSTREMNGQTVREVCYKKYCTLNSPDADGWTVKMAPRTEECNRGRCGHAGCIRIPESHELQELRRNIVKYSLQHIQKHKNHM